MHAKPFLIASIALLALVIQAGCGGSLRRADPGLPAPRVTTSVTHTIGGTLRGSDATPDMPTVSAIVDPATSFQVVVHFVALELMPESELGPLSARARYYSALEGERTRGAAAHLLRGARAGTISSTAAYLGRVESGELGVHVSFTSLRGALPVSATARFEVRGDLPGTPGVVKATEGVTLSVHRAARGGKEWLDVAVELSAGRATTTGALVVEREIAALDLMPLRASNDIALVLPEPFPETRAEAILALVSVSTPPPPGAVGAAMHEAACIACAADLIRESALAHGHSSARARRDDRDLRRGAPELDTIRRALTMHERRRDALLSLASQVGAGFAEDMSFADDALLAPVIEAVSEELAQFTGRSTDPALTWIVERSALRGSLSAIGPDGPPEILDVALVRHVGAVGRLPATLLSALESSADASSFAARITAENRDLLEDGDPAMRVRAQEWLAARGIAPPGFDPLAAASDRREALESAADPQGSQP